MTPYYEHDGITIYNGDCREILPTLPKVDLVFTSPPYNLGVSSGGGFPTGNAKGMWAKASRAGGLSSGYETYNDAMPVAEYEQWQRQILSLCWDRLTDSGGIFYNHKPRVQNCEVWLPLTLNPGLPLRQIITWARAGGVNYAPTHYLPTYEWILLFAMPKFRLKSKSISSIGDVWRVAQEANTEHPAPFPIALPIMALHSVSAERVLDPFSGSGTTALACKRLGRKCIGIEISEAYCEIAARRVEAERLTLFEAAGIEQMELPA